VSVSKPYPSPCYQPLNSSAANNPNPDDPNAKGLHVGANVYCEKEAPWVINESGLDKFLAGVQWIPTCYNDRDDASEELLTIKLKEAVANVFIAYDARTTTKPDWLEDDYEIVTYQGYGKVVIKIYYAGAGGKPVELELWRRRSEKMPASGTSFSIPGNMYYKHQKPVWDSSVVPGTEAMYMVLIEPKTQYDCTNLAPEKFDKQVYYNSCDTSSPCLGSLSIAETKAIESWQEDMVAEGIAYEGVVCKQIQVCPDSSDVGMLTQTVRSWVFEKSSEIKFSESPPFASSIDLDIPSKNVHETSGANGSLYFEYNMNELNQMEKMLINGLTLELADVWEFKNIALALLAPFEATCFGIAPFGVPCNQYKIPKYVFAVSLAADHGDKKVLVVEQNPGDYFINVDAAHRTVEISGNLKGDINIDGDDTPLDLTVKAKGYFHNFAPQANSEESKPFSDCVENKNKLGIYLDASTSKDPDTIFGANPKPNDIVGYNWYENFGTPTEYHWGSGKQITIPSQALDFGVHQMTLMVRDSEKIRDLEAFQVVVFDQQAPALEIPTDLYFLFLSDEPMPTKVVLGSASGSDACCDDVLVTNDGPTDRLFMPGVHQITWAADDGRGNVTEEVQKVHIWVAKDTIFPTFKEIMRVLEAELNVKLKALHTAEDAQKLGSEIGSMARVLEQLTRLSPEKVQASGERERFDQIRQQLKGVQFSLAETAGFARRHFGNKESQAESLKDFRHRMDRDVRLLGDINAHLLPMKTGE
jgi:hypothetical protein